MKSTNRSLFQISISHITSDSSSEANFICCQACIAKTKTMSSGRSLMHRGKRVGPKMEPWGTPGWTQHCCNNFLPRTTQSLLLLRNEEITSNTQPKIPKKTEFMKKTSMPKPVKASDISNAAAKVAPDLLKVYPKKLSKDLQLNEKTWKHTKDQKKATLKI